MLFNYNHMRKWYTRVVHFKLNHNQIHLNMNSVTKFAIICTAAPLRIHLRLSFIHFAKINCSDQYSDQSL